MAGERLIEVMRQVTKKTMPVSSQTDIVFGQVTAIDPLVITIENSLKLTEDLLLLSPFVSELKLDAADITETAHTHTIPTGTTGAAKTGITAVMLWEGLKIADRVLMLRVTQGQQYLVLWRV